VKLDPTQELLAASDQTIEDAVAHADPMLLRGLLYQLAGDDALVDLSTESISLGNFFATRIAGDDTVAAIREKAFRFLKGLRDGGSPVALGDEDRLYRALGLSVGVDLPQSERGIWIEQTALDPWARGLEWHGDPAPGRKQGFRVAVIGAGLSGLNAAVHLKRAGIDFQVFEKNADVGGTWYENRYPGARVDTPSRSYTHLFGTRFSYPYAYCPQEENLKYMRWVADEFGLRGLIEFGTEVTAIIWDEAAQEWELSVSGKGETRTMRFNAVISCVGFLSRPRLPEFEGMESFAGVACHTARWPDDLDVAGKRVAIIGSGASGYQTTPVIAKQAEHTYLFQRTPSWCFDNPIYLSPLPDQSLWLDRNFPFYVNFARFRLSWIYGPDGFKLAARIDPEFEDAHARSETNRNTRDARVAFIRRKLASRPDLIEKMIPDAPPISSRPVIVDGDDCIYDALLRDDVTLVTDQIERITPAGIVAGGKEIELDVIVYATGFKANDFLWPMAIVGRGGARMEEVWQKDGPRAYLGSMVPGFPNFFMSYGPNTNNFGGFQVVDLLEMEIRFALQCIGGLITRGKSSVDVTTDAYWRFNDELDREEAMMIYMDPRAHNYYQQGGRSCVNCPIDFRQMWAWLRDPDIAPQNTADAPVRPWFGEDLIVA
jgi:4-hydroxyacetophenone monooxygenase